MPFKYHVNKTEWKCEHLKHFNLQTNNLNNTISRYCSCNNGRNIPLSMINGLVSDCGSQAEDEYLLKALSAGKMLHCINKWQIPCREGHPRCYSFSQICLYKFNEYKILTPCRTGEHLQNCRNFECNMMYKCTSYYCIPWLYVCNRQWDCPFGYDEVDCSESKTCLNLFKCKKHMICFHLADVCNGKVDCPTGDDELFCSVQKIMCPIVCDCLTFAIRCYGIERHMLTIKYDIPYYVVHFEETSNLFVLEMLQFIHHPISITIVRNMLDRLCNIIPTVDYVLVVDAGFNKLEVVETDCFEQAPNLKVIKLNVNRISTIKLKGFYNLTSLLLLELSNNVLALLNKNMFIKLLVLETLIIKNNCIEPSNFDDNALYSLSIKILKTDDYILCCLLPVNARCTAKLP